jgi:hypothetical protein
MNYGKNDKILKFTNEIDNFWLNIRDNYPRVSSDEILSGIGRFGDEIDQLKDDGEDIDYSDVPLPEDPTQYID